MHFGIVMIVNLEIGYLTPPLGLNLIVAMSAFAGGHLLFLATPGRGGGVRTGSVLFGAILAGALAVVLVARYHRIGIWDTLDAAAPAGCLPPLFGRLGCFTAGCCHGTPTELPWAVTYAHPGSAAPPGVPLHPTQLYAAVALAALFLLLQWRRPRRAFVGEIGLLYLGLYSLVRFGLEFLRGDEVRGFVAGGWLSFSQAVAIPTFLVAAALYVRGRSGARVGDARS